MRKIMRNNSKRRAAREIGVRHRGEIFWRDGSMTGVVGRDGLRAREQTLDMS
jgi:hypothetical protein